MVPPMFINPLAPQRKQKKTDQSVILAKAYLIGHSYTDQTVSPAKLSLA